MQYANAVGVHLLSIYLSDSLVAAFILDDYWLHRHYDGCMEAIVTNPNINVFIYIFQASSVPMVVEGKAMDLVP